MKTRILGLACAVALSAFVMGCDSNEDDDGGNLSIDGLWSLTTPEGEEEDVQYVLFAGDEGTIFDFMGDEFDEGPDCYVIEPFALERLGNNRFRITPENEGGAPLEITVQIDGNEMTVISALDTLAFLRSNRSVSELTPECT